MTSRPTKLVAVDQRRRKLLKAAGATALAGTLPFAPWSRMAAAATADSFTPDVEIELIARPDEVQLLSGERVRVQLSFNSYRGLFLYHCHNLVHEDMGMMRNFLVA